MSSIRLSGTSSGYYDLTVPAAAGTNSIDLSALPVKDSSGNLAITGQLGINTTGTGVSGQYGTGITVRRAVPEVHLQRDDGNGNGGILMDNASATKRLFVGTYNGSSETHIGTNGTQRLVVSTEGYVTTPNQPMVRMSLGSSFGLNNVYTTAPGGKITGFTVHENIGNHWNNSNSDFTCPVAGVYCVAIFWIKYPVAGAAHVDLYKNNSALPIRWRGHEGGSSYHQVGGTVFVTCAANDILQWNYFGAPGIHDNNGHWGIRLVG